MRCPCAARSHWPVTDGRLERLDRDNSRLWCAVNRHVWGFAEGVAGQAFALVAGLAVAVAVGNALPDFEPAILAFGVLAAPWFIGSGVPVYRHGEVGAAGVATGWLAVFAAVLLVVETTDDAGLAETLGYLLAGWLLVLVLEAIAAGIAMSIRRKASPPLDDIQFVANKYRPQAVVSNGLSSGESTTRMPHRSTDARSSAAIRRIRRLWERLRRRAPLGTVDRILEDEMATIGPADFGISGAGLVAPFLASRRFETAVEVSADPVHAEAAFADAMARLGRLLEGAPSGPERTVSGVIWSGFLNKNPAVVEVRIAPTVEGRCRATLTGTAKDGLVDQRTGEKAVRRVLGAPELASICGPEVSSARRSLRPRPRAFAPS